MCNVCDTREAFIKAIVDSISPKKVLPKPDLSPETTLRDLIIAAVPHAKQNDTLNLGIMFDLPSGHKVPVTIVVGIGAPGSDIALAGVDSDAIIYRYVTVDDGPRETTDANGDPIEVTKDDATSHHDGSDLDPGFGHDVAPAAYSGSNGFTERARDEGRTDAWS